MKPCKAKLPDGNTCPNHVDEGQQYCPYHLASQVADVKEILFKVLSGLGLGLGLRGFVAGFSKFVKFVASKL